MMMAPVISADDFAPEPIGIIEELPADYPAHWVLVHDFSFFHMFEGEIVVVDPLVEGVGAQYKGMMTASFIAAFQHSKSRNEHYVAETFYSRGARGGERIDVVTIYDPATLTVSGEIEIPPKRISGMPKSIMTGLLDNERFMGIYNFTPSQSVSIVDLENRSFVGEVATPGCGFIVPNGRRSFTSICSNGSLLTSQLKKDGTLRKAVKTEQVFDAETDPIFESVGRQGDKAYFPTFKGQVMTLDVSRDQIAVDGFWWLTDSEERNWRPGGMNPVTIDAAGRGYFLMNPEGKEGSHKDGGAEVWVYDLESQTRTARIELNTWGVSLGDSGSAEQPLLFVTNAEMAVDVYALPEGRYLRTLQTGAATPFLVYDP